MRKKLFQERAVLVRQTSRAVHPTSVESQEKSFVPGACVGLKVVVFDGRGSCNRGAEAREQDRSQITGSHGWFSLDKFVGDRLFSDEKIDRD